jgi:hypothetical protein
VNKTGGPDRRFRDNRELPVVLYEELNLRSTSGLNERLQFSIAGASSGFIVAVQALARVQADLTRRPVVNGESTKDTEDLPPALEQSPGTNSGTRGISLTKVIAIVCGLVLILPFLALALNGTRSKRNFEEKRSVEQQPKQEAEVVRPIEMKDMAESVREEAAFPVATEPRNGTLDLSVTGGTNPLIRPVDEQAQMEVEWRSLLDDQTLLRDLTAARTTDGVVIAGKIALPPQTQIAVELLKVGMFGKTQILASCRIHLDSTSTFESKPFFISEKELRPGKTYVQIVSQFDNSWQEKEILLQVGEGGRFLPKDALTPDFPDLPEHTRHFPEVRQIPFPKK